MLGDLGRGDVLSIRQISQRQRRLDPVVVKAVFQWCVSVDYDGTMVRGLAQQHPDRLTCRKRPDPFIINFDDQFLVIGIHEGTRTQLTESIYVNGRTSLPDRIFVVVAMIWRSVNGRLYTQAPSIMPQK